MAKSQDSNFEICPVCCGGGGVRGGCYECLGSGWIMSEMRRNHKNLSIAKHRHDKSRISNSDYLGENQGAHYRERDGRIGSNPEHDDYSENGSA